MNKISIAVIQATPVFFDIEATTEKTIDLIKKAAEKEAQLVVFPESFIPGYPRGMNFGAVIGRRSNEGRELYRRYRENSLEENDTYFKQLSCSAKENQIYLAIGATEKDRLNSSLYCSYFYFAPDGNYLGKHRKIKPTGSERVVWAEGGADTLTVIDSEIGIFGGLICWENYMPLARQAIYNKGVEIYLAPTADARDEWQTTMKHIALESRSFVAGCNQYITKNDYPEWSLKNVQKQEDLHCRGGSVIISPMGKTLAGPVYDKEEIIIGEIDKDDISRGKMDLDVAGHYSRNDIFQFETKGQPKNIIHNK